ncbi:UPF0182 family protein [Haloimpatiens lingqiaonensis]|uniref:UPF0182 family protein n=1 Tax=Haloimpatiens lingqiaonensis TaxID=1380675 RepID=UPI0010FEAD97|nr:UPF0182 family protein [Haloimpatiens lingqiaonensis]
MKKNFKVIIPLFVIVLVLAFFNSMVNVVVDIKWFKEVGYLSVYFTKLLAVLKIMLPVFLLVFFALLIYYNSLKKSIYKWKGSTDTLNSKKYNKLFIFFDLVISFIISFNLSKSYWYTILQYKNSVDFNLKDPMFNKDISFFVFKLPLIQSIYNLLMTLCIVLVIGTFITYVVLNARDKIINGGNLRNTKIFTSNFKSDITKFAGRQLAVVSALILLLLSLGYMIKSWNLVYSPRGVVFGASYTDVKVSLYFYKVIAVLAIVTSVVVFVSLLLSKVKPIVISIVLIFLLIIGENLAAVFVQNFVVKSNEKTLEKKYIEYNMDYTKKGFNIDKVDSKDFPIKNDLTAEDLKGNKETIENIKINSVNQVLEYYNQIQVLKYYYTFKDMDVDRYNVNGKNTQVFMSTREIDVNSLKDKASTWQNRHLTYTHGYGVVMNKVNAVTSSGKPEFLIKDIPIENSMNIDLKDPRIYFGEETNEYAVVNTKIGELDYPEGDNNKTSKYNGTAGIKMSGINKVLFSIYEKNPKFLLSRDITKESKIIINRNIMERVKKIAPFILYDKDPYVVINEGKLYWIIDGYSISDRYPFSQPYNKINYIRNSVKVVIDAVNGDTDFYIVDDKDPVIKNFSKIFPKLFKEYSKMPEGLKAHLKYPEDLFNMQCSVLGKYHVTDPTVFYSGDDLWDISKNEKQVDSGNKEEKNPPSYIIMKLPGENKEEMVVTQYFNVNGKNNMESLLCGRMDGENYGKLVLYNFNNDPVESPYLFKQSIKQDANISKEISLWNQKGSGSGVIFGDTQIIPIKNSLLYIEPLYIRASGKESIPQMKRVIVSYGDKMVIEESIEKALNQVFNIKNSEEQKGKDEQKTSNEPVNTSEIKKAKELYDKALEAQKKGDWTKYGEYINELGKLLEEYSK